MSQIYVTSYIEISMKADIEEALKCAICLETATLPVHPKCCENAKAGSPACMSCVREYCQLNKRKSERDLVKKTWTFCGCVFHIRDINSSSQIYEHSYQLDMIRNILGPSTCPNGCGVVCTTSAELRRHLTGGVRTGESEPCPEARTKCKFCQYFGKRKDVEGSHYEKWHAAFECPVCKQMVKREDGSTHHMKHIEDIEKMRTDLRLFSENMHKLSSILNTNSSISISRINILRTPRDPDN
jgi:sarcosine oxidase delta subunit